MANENTNVAVSISPKAAELANAEKERLAEQGVRMSLGAIVSKAVAETLGKEA